MLRTASLNIIRSLGIEGGCNVQLALAPRQDVVPWPPESMRDGGGVGVPHDEPLPYYVIEVNPRVSRSSALASKATGYPIARVAAKIAAGKRLDEIANQVTGRTQAAFEPALDYCVVKIPRWPFDKFEAGDRVLGTQMKATGEVMAIDRSFEAALQKAVRSLEIGGRSVLWEDANAEDDPTLAAETPTDIRLWHLLAAVRSGVSIAEIARRSGVDPWFLERLEAIVQMERRLLAEPLTPTADASREADGICRRADRQSGRQRRRTHPRAAPRLGHQTRLQDGRHLRGRVRRGDTIFSTRPMKTRTKPSLNQGNARW